MKVDYKGLGMMAVVALAVVYASNNDLPVIGNNFRKAMNGGTGWL